MDLRSFEFDPVKVAGIYVQWQPGAWLRVAKSGASYDAKVAVLTDERRDELNRAGPERRGEIVAEISKQAAAETLLVGFGAECNGKLDGSGREIKDAEPWHLPWDERESGDDPFDRHPDGSLRCTPKTNLALFERDSSLFDVLVVVSRSEQNYYRDGIKDSAAKSPTS